jgi:hypothetical protein
MKMPLHAPVAAGEPLPPISTVLQSSEDRAATHASTALEGTGEGELHVA